MVEVRGEDRLDAVVARWRGRRSADRSAGIPVALEADSIPGWTAQVETCPHFAPGRTWSCRCGSSHGAGGKVARGGPPARSEGGEGQVSRMVVRLGSPPSSGPIRAPA